MTVVVSDVDRHFAKTKAEGGRIVEELHETIYGERQYGIEDLAGHHWLFSQHAQNRNPEEWGATVAEAILSLDTSPRQAEESSQYTKEKARWKAGFSR